MPQPQVERKPVVTASLPRPYFSLFRLHILIAHVCFSFRGVRRMMVVTCKERMFQARCVMRKGRLRAQARVATREAFARRQRPCFPSFGDKAEIFDAANLAGYSSST